jgi:hypothetical protein
LQQTSRRDKTSFGHGMANPSGSLAVLSAQKDS